MKQKIRKEEVNYLFADDITAIIENLKEYHKHKHIRTNEWVQQGCRIQDKYREISCISIKQQQETEIKLER